ncbi:hypothetical protein TNCV_734441 [Trichonephila clavipes]|nr:hypothetical protein TNCV_734441 [Trichonephila clavipes]
MGCRLSFTIMAASLDVVTPRVQTINNGPMATCTGHFTAGEAVKFRDNRWVIWYITDSHFSIRARHINERLSLECEEVEKCETKHMVANSEPTT